MLDVLGNTTRLYIYIKQGGPIPEITATIKLNRMFIIITIPESEEVGRHSNSADIIKYNPKQSTDR